MSTHDIFRSREIADRVGIMRAGRLVAELQREEFLREDLERLYLDCMGEGSRQVTRCA
jgi:ABC-2 type transport system ATP-binding protein